MVTTITPWCARFSPSYPIAAPVPCSNPPPWIQTITGRRSSADLAGVQILRYRQSSLRGGGEGPYSPFAGNGGCEQALANCVASRTPVQEAADSGGFQRKSPTGG